MCRKAIPYVYENTNRNETYYFQLCGVSNTKCTPVSGYPLEFERGVAIQFFGEEPTGNENCTDKSGAPAPCTRNCEVLGTGVPVITTRDPASPFLGINVTHYGVPSLPTDPFKCPIDPKVRAPLPFLPSRLVTCAG